MAGGQFGPFRFLERIERGGPAELYRALWAEAPSSAERSCLVKRLRPELAGSPAFRAMFVQEARIMVHLRHPSIARVFAHGEIEGLPYLATEPLEGLSLARLLGAQKASGKRLPVEVAAYVAREVALALAHAHTATDTNGEPLAIVHRDVRPANIMLLPTGEVKLVDFGVARTASFVSQSANLAGAANGGGNGKPLYASPEQLAGASLDAGSDLFSLGATFWEMLVGRPLFPPGPVGELAARVLNAPLSAPAAVRPDLPGALDDIVMRLLERDRARRYPAAELLARDLGTFMPVPRDAQRAVASLVRTAFSVPLGLPGALLTPGPSGRPRTSVVPNVAALLEGAKMKALAGRLPGSLRKVTSMVPVLASRIGGAASSARKRIQTAATRAVPADGWLGRALALLARQSPVRRLALQATLAATISFVCGIMWQESRVDAASATLAKQSELVTARRPPAARTAVIERLPPKAAAAPGAGSALRGVVARDGRTDQAKRTQ